MRIFNKSEEYLKTKGLRHWFGKEKRLGEIEPVDFTDINNTIIHTSIRVKWEQNNIKHGKEESNMKSVSRILTSLMLGCLLLYQGYVMPEHNQKFEPPEIGVNAGWILLIISIFVLGLVYILFRTDAWFHKRKSEDH